MPAVLVAGAAIACSHGGLCRLPTGSPTVQVGGNGVVTAGMEAGLSFAPGAPGVLVPCPFATAAGPSPCTATTPATAGLATKLMVGGAPALLDTAGGQTINPQSPSTWRVINAGQVQLEAS